MAEPKFMPAENEPSLEEILGKRLVNETEATLRRLGQEFAQIKFLDPITAAYAFDDVTIPSRKSSVLPNNEADVKAHLTAGIELNIPILSAAMDTVTNSQLAIAMARNGGLGVLHRKNTIQEQADEVERVKRAASSIITNPITVSLNTTLKDVNELRKKYSIHNFPVVENGKLVGMLTDKDYEAALGVRLLTEENYEATCKTLVSKSVSQYMTSISKIKVAIAGISDTQAFEMILEKRLDRLPILFANGKLHGLATRKDLKGIGKYPHAIYDKKGRYLVGAAVGVGSNAMRRAHALIEAGVDVIFVETAHGHHINVINMVHKLYEDKLRQKHKVPIIGGNIATALGAYDLVEAGADGVKVGVGPGSICTTRQVSGCGVPQVTATMDAYIGVEYARWKFGIKHVIPVITDGGLKYSGDITKSLASGATCVMFGNMLAGTDEAPGEIIEVNGAKMKYYRGMGSLAVMKESRASRDRYGQHKTDDEKLVPEGIEGAVPLKGPVYKVLDLMVGGLRSGMGNTGCATVYDLVRLAQFHVITGEGLKESRVHDVVQVSISKS